MGKQGWWFQRGVAAGMGVSCALLMVTAAQAATIVAYDGANSPTGAAATEWLAGVTPLQLSRGAGLNAGSGATFNSTGWNDEAGDFLEWGWSASQAIDLIDLDLRYDRSASGPSLVDIQLSVNGGVFTSVFNDALVDDAGEDVLDVDLTSFSNVTSATFRLIGTGATSGSGTFDLEPLTGVSPSAAIMVSGTAVPVPEPSSQLLTLLGLVGLLISRRWR